MENVSSETGKRPLSILFKENFQFPSKLKTDHEINEPPALSPQDVMSVTTQRMLELSQTIAINVPQGDDSSTLEYVEFPVNGGVLTHLASYKSPYRGFPYFEIVGKIDETKKVMKLLVERTLSWLFQNKFRVFWAILAFPFLRGFSKIILASFHERLIRIRPKKTMYCKSLREILRATDKSLVNIKGEQREILEMIKDFVLIISEFDNAYRFRLQDILPGINKLALKENPIREFRKIACLMEKREVYVEMKGKIRMIMNLFIWFLRVFRSYRKVIIAVIQEIDFEKVKLDEYDKEFCHLRIDYSFGYKNALKAKTN